jgi:filamentous hemagglutinin family protein
MAQQKAPTASITRILNTRALGKRLMATSAMTFAGMLAMSASAYAVGQFETPTGGTFAEGTTGTIGTTGANNQILNVTTNQQRTVMDWTTFNIGTGATANFNQLNTSSTTINRVNGSVDPTQILGELNSNGKIVILDPNGVFFGAGSKVSVGSILASTGEIGNLNHFLKGGNDPLQLNNLDAKGKGVTIENRGNITTTENGGLVALVAPNVKNAGIITAQLGKVILASGKKVSVDLYGDGLISIASDELEKSLVENSGTITANGGTVVMTAGAAKKVVDSVVNLSGVVQASEFKNVGGKIVLGGGSTGKVDVKNNATVKATTIEFGSDVYTNNKTLSVEAQTIDLNAKFYEGTYLFGIQTGNRLMGQNKLNFNAERVNILRVCTHLI